MKTFFLFLFFLFLANSFIGAAQNRPLIIAHRGASGYAPENTFASIKKALELGVDVIEIDIHQTKDSQLVVMHDVTLDRTSNISGRIKDYNWAEIKNANVGSWFSEKYATENIPLFTDVLGLINGKAKLLIEIKTGGDYYPGIEKRAVDIIGALGAESWCLFHSFSDSALVRLKKTETKMQIYKLVLGNIGFHHIDNKLKGGRITQYTYTGTNPNVKFTHRVTIRKLHNQNRIVFVWTANKKRQMKRLIKWGADGIITNYPELAIKLMSK